jgi:hypothetical protein
MKKLRSAVVVLVAAATLLALTSCAGVAMFGEGLNRALKGVSATMTTYTQNGDPVDRVVGQSFEISRDTRFDTTDSDGNSNQDSSVLMISLGNSHISHVGSTLVLAQDGIVDVSQAVGTKVAFENKQSGVPWLNNLLEYNRNLWQGKGKTIMIRSQNGIPVAVYAGNEVEIFATDVPKSTCFRVDGKYLFVYRADYTVYDNDLLQ